MFRQAFSGVYKNCVNWFVGTDPHINGFIHITMWDNSNDNIEYSFLTDILDDAHLTFSLEKEFERYRRRNTPPSADETDRLLNGTVGTSI